MATQEYRSRAFAARTDRPAHPNRERDVVVRFVLKIALAFALVAGIGEAAYAAHRLQADWGTSARTSERQLSRQLGIDPAVVDRIGAILPPGAHYRFEESSKLQGTFIGPTFEALLRARLLPRLRVQSGSDWRISWGVPLGAACCRFVRNVGQPSPQTSPVYVSRDG